MTVQIDQRAASLERTHHDLLGALRGAAADARERLGLDVDLTFGGETMHPIAIVAALDELVREALDNTARHSGVTVASIDVNVDDAAGELWLRVRDHGRGFDQARDGGGVGRDTYFGRAADAVHALGGTLIVASAPAQGAMVRVRMPFASA